MKWEKPRLSGAFLQQACKPDSVGGDHLSRPPVARRLEQRTRLLGGPPRRSLLRLAPDGVWKPSRHRDAGGLLPHLFTLTFGVSGEFSPLAVSFLCHFPSAFAAWDFPSVLPFGVRTFLGPARAGPRSPGLQPQL
jgi:hypothetical protein